jgi:hypothetical protein
LPRAAIIRNPETKKAAIGRNDPAGFVALVEPPLVALSCGDSDRVGATGDEDVVRSPLALVDAATPIDVAVPDVPQADRFSRTAANATSVSCVGRTSHPFLLGMEGPLRQVARGRSRSD